MNRSTSYLLLMLLFFSSTPLIAQTDTGTNTIIETKNLTALGKSSGQTNRPILLLMSTEDCPFCRLIKREILNPMVISGNYDNRIIMRELMIDSNMELPDFDGNKKDAAIIAGSYKIKVSPTLLFLGSDGRELTERMIGINTPELYSVYVDRAINMAISNFKGK